MGGPTVNWIYVMTTRVSAVVPNATFYLCLLPTEEIQSGLKWGSQLWTRFGGEDLCPSVYLSLGRTQSVIEQKWHRKQKKSKKETSLNMMQNVSLIPTQTHVHRHVTLSDHVTAVAINAWCYVEVRTWASAFTWGAANSDKTGGGSGTATAGPVS